MTETQTQTHQPMTLLVGPEDCFERECEDYFTEAGDPDPGVERCSHVKDEQVCTRCSTEQPDGSYEPTVAWPCPNAA